MKLVVGLGNPGEKYRNSRHNVGCLVVEKLKESKNQKLQAVKTNTSMNDSGVAVKKLLTKYDTSSNEMYVVFDDLDIKLGQYKIQFAKGPYNHKGVNSIYDELGSKDFWHVRVGVDNRDPQAREDGDKYILQDFPIQEREILDKILLELCKKLATY